MKNDWLIGWECEFWFSFFLIFKFRNISLYHEKIPTQCCCHFDLAFASSRIKKNWNWSKQIKRSDSPNKKKIIWRVCLQNKSPWKIILRSKALPKYHAFCPKGFFSLNFFRSLTKMIRGIFVCCNLCIFVSMEVFSILQFFNTDLLD